MLSVIVPIYNSEKYLRKCIDSILNQIYKDLEIILIDDGSKDSSGSICDEYAAKHKNIMVHHQENKGLVAARKQGVSMAQGEYVTFVDSDDWIEEDCYQQMLKCTSEQPDIVMAGVIYDRASGITKETDLVEEGFYQWEDIKKEILGRMMFDERHQTRAICSAVWNKFFKAALIKEIIKDVDEEVTYGEDAVITYTAISVARNLVVTHYCGYHYCIYEGSMCRSYSTESFFKISRFQKCIERKLSSIRSDINFSYQIRRYVETFLQQAIHEVYGSIQIPGWYSFPYHLVPKGSRIILYGGGKVGQSYYSCLEDKKYAEVVAWADSNYDKFKTGNIVWPKEICKMSFDYIVLSVLTEKTADAIRKTLLQLGIPNDKIVWEKPKFTRSTMMYFG